MCVCAYECVRVLCRERNNKDVVAAFVDGNCIFLFHSFTSRGDGHCVCHVT